MSSTTRYGIFSSDTCAVLVASTGLLCFIYGEVLKIEMRLNTEKKERLAAEKIVNELLLEPKKANRDYLIAEQANKIAESCLKHNYEEYDDARQCRIFREKSEQVARDEAELSRKAAYEANEDDYAALYKEDEDKIVAEKAKEDYLKALNMENVAKEKKEQAKAVCEITKKSLFAAKNAEKLLDMRIQTFINEQGHNKFSELNKSHLS